MQLSVIRNEVKIRLGIADTDQMFTAAVINTIINASLRRFSLVEDWPWLESSGTIDLLAGSNVMNTTGARKVRWVTYEDDEIVFRNYRDLSSYNDRTGRPLYYTEDSNVFLVMPTPEQAYTLKYGFILSEPTLVDDTDEPLVPDWAIDTVISDACVLLSRRQRDRDLEKVFYAEYRNSLKNLRDEIVSTTEGWLPRRTGSTY